MAIACAHCAGRHQTTAEVRACWASDNGPIGDGESQHASDQSPTPVPTQMVKPSVHSGPACAGPDALGRNAIVAPGVDPGPPWASSSRVRIGQPEVENPCEVIGELRRARVERRRVVIELDPDVDVDSAPVPTSTSEPFALGPTFVFEAEELHHLVWSNAVDLRQPESPTWRLLDQAVDAGAAPVEADADGDVIMPNGVSVWLDGGPPRVALTIDGLAVLSAVNIQHGHFAVPVGNQCDADLAPDQLAAVTHSDAAARIIAPAGSGKTRVLTERARHLLTNWNLPSSAVTLVAFNKRAQEEMRDRTSDLPGLQVRTLNSLALAIVNGTPPFASQPRRWTTIDEPDVRRLISDLVSFPRRRNSDPIALWIEALGMVRLGLVPPEKVESLGDGDIDGFAEFWPTYEALLERRGAVDFDDQIRRALLVLLTDPAAREAARRACRVLLVDEFQDLTPAHLLMVRLLSWPDGAVFGVGDDDQTIYGYNGADPAWLIDFADLFPDAGSHPLEVNYRCPAGVVEAVDRLLRHNRRRVSKLMRAKSELRPGWTIDGRRDVVAATTEAVRGALDDGLAPQEVAVLSRVRAVLAPVQTSLVTAGVPIAGGVGVEFMDRTSVRAVLAWLRLAVRDSSLTPDDLREALRRPSRSLHPRITDWVCEQTDVAALLRLAARLNNERDSDRVTDFATDIQRLARMAADGVPTSDIVLTLTDEMGLGGAVASLDTSRRGMNRASQGDDLTAMRHLAAQHDDVAGFEGWLRELLSTRRTPEGVLLATVHRVKGQEWPRVVVHHADAEQYPHRLAEDVEEERRLFHVALTRASQHVTITTGSRPTPFIDELTNEPKPDAEVRTHAPDPVKAPRRTSGSASLADDLDEASLARFEALRELRGELRDGKPAYVVFDNKTLVAIARDAPTTSTELARIPGIGPAKLERYGEPVLALINQLLG